MFKQFKNVFWGLPNIEKTYGISFKYNCNSLYQYFAYSIRFFSFHSFQKSMGESCFSPPHPQLSLLLMNDRDKNSLQMLKVNYSNSGKKRYETSTKYRQSLLVSMYLRGEKLEGWPPSS
jgi:hypothetical protein